MRTMMKVVVAVGFVGAVAGATLATVRAEQLNAEQIQIIRDTAVAICNTVKEAKGQKSDTQIQGEVKANLSGLLGRVFGVDAGATGTGSRTNEKFEGLSQDATATALEGDRGCRERVFDKMMDKLSSGPQPDQNPYIAGGRKRSDLRTVRQYIDKHKLGEWQDTPDPCSVPSFLEETRNLSFDDKMIHTSHITLRDGERCSIPSKRTKNGTWVDCSANLSDLDEIIDLRQAIQGADYLPGETLPVCTGLRQGVLFVYSLYVGRVRIL